MHITFSIYSIYPIYYFIMDEWYDTNHEILLNDDRTTCIKYIFKENNFSNVIGMMLKPKILQTVIYDQIMLLQMHQFDLL